MGAVDPTREGDAPEAVPAAGVATRNPAAGRSSRAGTWLAPVLAALAAGLVAWAATEWGLFRVQPAEEKVSMMGVEFMSPTGSSRAKAVAREISGSLGAFGLLLGAGLGLAGAVPSRSWRRAMAGAAVGGVIGATAGIFMPWAVLPWYNRAEEKGAGDLIRSMLMHLGLWGPLGAAAGLGFGVARTEPRRWVIAFVGGAVGAAIATLLYDVLGAALFPLAETGSPVSEAWFTRLMALLLVALATAATTVAFAESTAGTARIVPAGAPERPPQPTGGLPQAREDQAR